jgi:acylphosphatase
MPTDKYAERFMAYVDQAILNKEKKEKKWWEKIVAFFQPEEPEIDPIKRRYTARILTKGKVQDVGFRTKAKSIAAEVELVGIAENLPDGSIQMIVTGTPYQIKELHDWSKVGPGTAFVTTSECEILPEVREFTSFQIVS